MNSEHQDGTTEPASKATVWDFVIGKSGGANLRNSVIMDSQANIMLVPHNSELLGQLVAATQPPKAGVK